MRVLYAVLCETAESRDDGRVDLQGIFQQLFAPGFPAQQDRMTLALALEWAPEEEGRFPFRIDLVDPGGSPAFTINGHTDVARIAPGEAPAQTRLLMPLDDVVFPRAGTYEFELHAGGEQRRVAPLHLIENPDLG